MNSLFIDEHLTEAIVNGDYEGMRSVDSFLEDFTFIGNTFLSDPNENFHEGVALIAVIERNSDGAKFGIPYYVNFECPYDPYYENVETEERDDVLYFKFDQLEKFDYPGYRVL